MMCRLLEVSRSGYYASCNRPKSTSVVRRDIFLKAAREIFEKNKGIPGYRKIHRQLKNVGYKYSRESVRKLCQRAGIRSRVQQRRYRPKTTDSNHRNKVNDNILNRDFKASRPNEKWLTDITYIETAEGFVYLSGIIDMYSRRIVGWNIETHLRAELVMETLRRAIQTRGQLPATLLFHSDRGVQYTANEFRTSLKLLGIDQSMSGKGECWDNTPCESCWGKLKTEWIN